MSFASHSFVLIFFPLLLILVGLVQRVQVAWRRQAQKALLALANFCFLWSFGWKGLLTILAFLLLNYVLGLGQLKQNRWRLGLSLSLNLVVLVAFKYLSFLFGIFHVDSSFRFWEVIGLSYLFFQLCSYQVDRFRGELESAPFWDFMIGSSLWMNVVSGPIALPKQVLPQLRDYGQSILLTHEGFSRALLRFTLGLAKKKLLADALAPLVSNGYKQVAQLGSLEAWVLALAFALQLYFDFSGYSDMAIGLASAFGLKLPENFNSPYRALSIKDFWSRWHQSLTQFLTRYLYVPLGGSRGGAWRTNLNILIVFGLSGLWHGPRWTFLAWGLVHGLWSVAHRYLGQSWVKLPVLLQRGMTFVGVLLTWVLFRSSSFSQAIAQFRAMFSPHRALVQSGLLGKFYSDELRFLDQVLSRVGLPATLRLGLLWTSFFLFCLWLVFRGKPSQTLVEEEVQQRRYWWAYALLLAWCLCSLASVSGFIYENF